MPGTVQAGHCGRRTAGVWASKWPSQASSSPLDWKEAWGGGAEGLQQDPGLRWESCCCHRWHSCLLLYPSVQEALRDRANR